MKFFYSILLLLLSLSLTASAQTDLSHPTDSDAELLGTFTVSTSLDPASDFESQAAPNLLAPSEDLRISRTFSGQSSGSGSCLVSGEVVVWRTVGGRVDYILDPATIAFSGPCCEADLMSTSAIFAQVSRQGLAQGILLGLSPCPASCSVPTLARVYTASCVQRTGNCTMTGFSACTENLAYREYSYCCMGGSPIITELGSVGGGCAAPCESTIGLGGGSLE